jgi:hypothetical protein
MRRIILLAGLVGVLTAGTAVAGLTQTSGASTRSHLGPAHVAAVPSGTQLEPQWTIERIGTGGTCAILTFKAGSWTSDIGGNKGTAELTGKKLVLTWTAGGNKGLTFTGTYAAPTGSYSGMFGGTSSGAAQLEPGAVPSWQGFTC